MSSGPGSQKTETKPWKGLRPYLSTGFQYALRDILQRPLEFFPGSTVTPFSPETELGLGGITNRAAMGSSLNPAAQGQVMDTLGGEYFAQGGAFDAAKDAIASSVIPGVDSTFGAGRRFGSPLHAEAISRGVSRGLSPYLDAERGRMMQASALAPQLAREDYFDMDRLLGVGAQREDLYSRELADQMARWDFAQQEPAQRIGTYMSMLQGGSPYGTTKTSGGGGGKGPGQIGLGALGGAATIAGMGGPGGFGWWG